MNEITLCGLDGGSEKPSRLDFLAVLKIRSPELFSEHEKLYNSLYAGHMGELEVVRYFNTFGRENWCYIQNYWADYHGSFESDLIVFTSNHCLVLEVKNYTGLFEYHDGISTVDGFDYNTDSTFQARRSYKNVSRILSKQIHSQNVSGALIFIGEHNEVSIQSRVSEIDILQRNQLMRFIQKIAEEESQNRSRPLNMQAVQSRLEQFQIHNPYTIEPLTAEQMAHVRKGIVCANCSRFNVEITRKFVRCSECMYEELREEAMVRTICEYGVLRYDDQLRRNDLYHFLNGQSSKRALTNTLVNHFDVVNKNKYTYYMNKMKAYSQIKSHFIF